MSFLVISKYKNPAFTVAAALICPNLLQHPFGTVLYYGIKVIYAH
jgi:hypothetical protein